MKTTFLHRAHINKTTLHLDDAFYDSNCKHSDKNEQKIFIEGVIKHSAGQDTIISKKINDNELIIGCFDGHGENGHYHSYIASSLLLKILLKCIPIFKIHFKSNNLNKINKLITYCYNYTQTQLYDGSFINIDRKSGTTASVAIILNIEINGKYVRKLISTNAGDSPIIWKEQDIDSIIECSLEHNCDNLEAVAHYLKRLKKRKEYITNKLKDENNTFKEITTLNEQLLDCHPKPVYYFREQSPVSQWLVSEGYSNPLILYNYINDKPELNYKDYEFISQYYPHGNQSIRFPDTYKRNDGRIVAIQGKEHDNWGSSLEGNTQTLNGLGDIQHFPHTSPEPFISIQDIDKGTLLVASDGIMDLYHFDELMRFIENNSNKEDLTDIMYEYIFNTGKKYPQYKSSYNNLTGFIHPKWDDVSGIIVSID